jgi:hypothetical protein
MRVVEYGCNILSQNLNTHLTDVNSAAAARTLKNQRKRAGKLPAWFAPHAKKEAKSWKTDKLFVRFLKRNGCGPREFKGNRWSEVGCRRSEVSRSSKTPSPPAPLPEYRARGEALLIPHPSSKTPLPPAHLRAPCTHGRGRGETLLSTARPASRPSGCRAGDARPWRPA